MRVLITGGFGYLGGRLAQFLAEDSECDILLGTRRRIASAEWLPSATVVKTEWESPERLESICAGVDAIVHLAGMNARDCAADPAGALEVNGAHTAALVRAACRQRARRFVYLSTAHVYGSPLAGTITESTCPTSAHPYATSHRAGEDSVRAAHLGGEIEGIVVRLSNSYGAPASMDADCWTLLMNDLCRQAVAKGRLELRSSGMERRDFIPMSEACRAIAHLLRLPTITPEGCLFNVGGQWAPTVRAAAELVQARCDIVLGFRPALEHATPQPDETTDDLDYRLDALVRGGFQPMADKNAELDQLLDFCGTAFG